MKQRRNHARPRAESQPHVDIPDLRDRRERGHAPDIVFPDGGQRAHNHARKAKGKQDVGNLAVHDDRFPEHPVIDLDQQDNIALGYQAG